MVVITMNDQEQSPQQQQPPKKDKENNHKSGSSSKKQSSSSGMKLRKKKLKKSSSAPSHKSPSEIVPILKKSLSTTTDDNSNFNNNNEESITKCSHNRKVHWNHKVTMKRHHRLQDLTEEEIDSVWYTESDTKIILAMAKVTVKMMMRGEPCNDDEDYCSRGLEGKTSQGAKRRQKNKAKVRVALLEEQELQKSSGDEHTSNPLADQVILGRLSRELSKEVTSYAQAQAVLDEKEIQPYLMTTMVELREEYPDMAIAAPSPTSNSQQHQQLIAQQMQLP